MGSILELNRRLTDPSLPTNILPKESVELVAGGPPCQSFSMAGLRQHDNSRNSLPWAFAEFVKHSQPKLAVLENVTGILRAFQTEDGPKHAWFEVAQAFAAAGYAPLCLHVNAKRVGAPQSRPRFILIAFRTDIAEALSSELSNHPLGEAIKESQEFISSYRRDCLDIRKSLSIYDVEKHRNLFSSGPLRSLVTHGDHLEVSVYNAIHDLSRGTPKKSNYVKRLNNTFRRPKHAGNSNKTATRTASSKKPTGTEAPSSSQRTKSRFRLYQLISRLEVKRPGAAKEIRRLLRHGQPGQATLPALQELSKIGQFIRPDDGKLLTRAAPQDLLVYLQQLATKKHSQKALRKNEPAPAALSIPDDVCHYRKGEYRTLSVREMARIQSFPDWFEFRSKVTTGGKARRFEVPQYTQVGNAVPPLLGRAIGEACKNLLAIAQKTHSAQVPSSE